MIARHGAQVMRTARRYAMTPEDAEDAYQRAVEIMLTKAPDIPDADLLPWLKTVVKHEAFAIRRQEERWPRAADGSLDGASEIEAAIASPVEQSERFERLRLGAEAMRLLKPQEVRALTLLAQGYSYQQICDATGWTYTKVNRCLAEGRQRFLQRVAGIESGDECRRLEPKLSALADGEASEEELVVLRRHLRRCLACRATFREQYLAPGVVGALAPSDLLGGEATLVERLHDLVATIKVKAASVVRLPGFDGGSGAGHPALSSGSGRLASAGLAKGLAVLAVGGAGVGGAIVGAERVLNSTAESADAATGQQKRDQPVPRRGRSSDPRLMAEGGGRSRRGRRAPGRGGKPLDAGSVDTDHTGGAGDVTPSASPSASRPGSAERHRSRAERRPRRTASSPSGDDDRRSPSDQRQPGANCEHQWGGFSGDESDSGSCSSQGECVDPSVAASSNETNPVVCSRQEGCVDASIAASSNETNPVVCSGPEDAHPPNSAP